MSSDPGSPRCLNCGAELAGPYCSACGQEDTELRVSLRRLAGDFLAEQLGLESKVPVTLWTLVRYPGQLTRDYLAGRRVRSLLPLRLYLSASVVYFLLLSVPQFGTAFKFSTTRTDRAALDSLGLRFSTGDSKATVSDSMVVFDSAASNSVSTHLPKNRMGAFAAKRLERFNGMKASEIGVFFKERFVRYMPNAIFVLLPVFTLILYMLYRKTGRFFAEHLIFTLHIHAFAFVALIVLLPLPDWMSWVVPVWILVHLYLAMRTVYGESRGKTFAKFAVLMIGYNIVLQLTMLAVIAAIFAVG